MKNIPEELSSYSPQVVAGGQGFASGFEIDYTSYFQRLLRNWYWFILAAILGILAAWLYLRYTTAVYSAQASMLVEEHSGSGMGFSKEAISQELGFEKSYVVENELQVLKSRQLMERVVILLGIDVSYIHQGKVKDTELYRPEQFSLIPADTLFLTEGEPIRYGNVLVRLDNENSFSLIKGEADTLKMQYGENFFVGNRRFNLQRTGKGESLPQDPTYLIKTENPINIATKYSNKLNLKQMGRSGVIELSIKDPVPAKAKDILNRVIDVYSQQIIEEQSQTGQQTLNFLEERLAFVTKELYDVESSVAGFKTNTGMSVDLATRGADYLEQLNESDAQLAELQVRKELIENLRYNLIADSTRFRTLPVASEVTSGVLASLVQQYNLAVYERDAKLETVTAEHPTMATYTDKLKNFRRSILQSISTVLAETNQRAQRIKERIRPLEENMNQIPENQRKLVQIMRKVQIKENLFMFLLEKREEAALTVAAQVPNTRIIDRAMASTGPIAPNRSMIYLMALGLALFVPGSTLFLRELMGSKLESEKDVKKYSSAPIIGRIVKNRTKASMIMETKARTAIGESFRMLRANLNYVLARDASSAILVTSGVSGEGKSFISANLAHSLALAKKKVVVVGMDLRKPKLGKTIFGQQFNKKAPGLSTYLVGKAKYENILQATDIEGLTVIQSGPVPPNPAELLLEQELTNLFERLREDFDVIIIDTPPIGLVSDALLLKEIVDVSIYVVRMGVTPKKNFEYIQEVSRGGKLPRINLILNEMNPKEVYGGSGYGYYK